ncbi:MAG: hypothetical protein ABSE95_10570 [Thermodesulfobacteriota bacterium]
MEEKNIGEALKSFQTAMAVSTRVIADGISIFQEKMKQAAASIQPAVDLFRELQKNIGPIFEEIARIVQALPERTRQALAALATHGWYVDSEMDLPIILSFVRLVEEGQVGALDIQLSSYFDQRSEVIRDRLCDQFPSRAQILVAAFKAHKGGEYDLSVPIFLAQADGICLEMTGVQLYSKRKVFEAIAAFDVDDFVGALLYPLTEVFPITFNPRERAGQEGILNRHAVLHGESVSYGNLINSSKAISLLAFTAWALADLKRKRDRKVRDKS